MCKNKHPVQVTACNPGYKKHKAKHDGGKSISKWREVKERGKGHDKVTEVASMQENNIQRDTRCVPLREQYSRDHKEGNKKREDSTK